MDSNKKKELIVFALIFLLGTFLRLYHLDYPLGLHGDEAWTGIEAQRILTEGSIGIWSFSGNGQPTLPFYWTAFIFKLLGANIITLRLSFSLLSIISLPFFYFVTKSLFSKKIALIAFFLFATARIPIHFSHIAYTAYLTPFLPAVFFFLIALKKQKKILYILAGIFSGLTPYFAPGLRILPILFLSFLLYQYLQKHFIKTQIKNLSIYIAVTFITVFPLMYFGLTNRELFLARTNAVSIFSTQGIQHARVSLYGNISLSEIILKQIKTAVFMFNMTGDGDTQDNYHNLPVFDLVSGLFFIIGFFLQLRKGKNDASIFLYLWFFVFLTGTIFTVDAPNFRRTQPSIAASYIFMTLGIIWTLNVLKKYVLKKEIFSYILLLGIISYSAYINIHTYFTQQAISEETKSTFSYPLVRVADFLHSLPQPVYVYLYSSCCSYHHQTLQFLLSNTAGEDRSKEFGMYSLTNNYTERNVVYIFFPEYRNTLFEVKRLYPNGESIDHKDINNTVIFTSYLLPKNSKP